MKQESLGNKPKGKVGANQTTNTILFNVIFFTSKLIMEQSVSDFLKAFMVHVHGTKFSWKAIET